jgi:hypothetical protein
MLWNICWRLSRRRRKRRSVARSTRAGARAGSKRRGNFEMEKNKGDRVEELVSGLDIWIWIRIRNRLDCIVHTLIHECVVFTIDSWSFGTV